MSQKKEISVNDLLNQLDNNPRPTKEATQNKQKKTEGWEQDDEQQYMFSFKKEDPKSTKPKATKKKELVKGWGEFESEQNDQKPSAPVEQESVQEDQPKKKIFKKPTGETKKTVDVKVDEEYFPSLGEEPPKNMPKKESEYKPQPAQVDASGPRRFMNTKKAGQGETFAPIETQEKEPVQQKEPPQRVHQPVIQRGTGIPQEKPSTEEGDGKIKFGTEGPKKFVSKVGHRKEEEKSEQDLLREAREKEIEEKLQKEREEAAKEAEARKARKGAFGDKKHEENKERHHKTDKPEEDHHHDKPQQEKKAHEDHKPQQEHDNGEPKKITKFSNSKKPPTDSKPKEVVPEPDTQKTEEPVKSQETKEVVVSASSKAWDEGAILKKPKKKE